MSDAPNPLKQQLSDLNRQLSEVRRDRDALMEALGWNLRAGG
jgi:hypothetical protein